MYARRVNDDVLDFDHRGWLYEESFLFYDVKTDSLWVQATGVAVHGPLKGKRLERLPATQTVWKQWRRLHPGTLVLGRSRADRFRYQLDSYADYYATGGGVHHQRKGPLSFGLAVILPEAPKLYPFAALKETPVLADCLGDTPIVVVYHADSRTAVAFDRRHEGRVLDFELTESEADDVRLTDRQTRSEWSGLTGRCLSGPMHGKQLRQLTTTQFVVENWPLHYPNRVARPEPEAKGARPVR